VWKGWRSRDGAERLRKSHVERGSRRGGRAGGVEGAEADICRGLMRSRAVKRGLKAGRERPSGACGCVVLRTWNGSRLREKGW